jgi:hypothetical protein
MVGQWTCSAKWKWLIPEETTIERNPNRPGGKGAESCQALVVDQSIILVGQQLFSDIKLEMCSSCHRKYFLKFLLKRMQRI